MRKLAKLIAKMEKELVIPTLSLSDSEIRIVLDQRDTPEFTKAWMTAFDELAGKKMKKQDADALVTRLRELAYLQAYSRWHSPDLAGYISDDFGLIGDALAIDYNENKWLNGLFYSYLTHQFPTGSVDERSGHIGEDL